jgi:hypothetical protein
VEICFFSLLKRDFPAADVKDYESLFNGPKEKKGMQKEDGNTQSLR